MTSSHIKIIAVITMVIDHVGLFFFPQLTIMRDIGRLAFPLFAWLIANGAYHTHDIKKYISRLFLLAFVSQIPFTIANQHLGSSPLYLNVVFTLCLGLLAIYTIKNTKNNIVSTFAVISFAEVANLIHSDYGAAGVLSIVAFYVFFNNKVATVISQIIILSLLPTLTALLTILKHTDLSSVYVGSFSETYGIISLIFIFLYNNKEGRKMKNFFYLFYPLQYVAIVAFQILLKN